MVSTTATNGAHGASTSASAVFLQVLLESGITTAFVNLGSDHPALLEAFADNAATGTKQIDIVTCPNEMVALSMAQGYGQATGRPAAVIVHVDVGTQALAGAIHNVDKNRTPVFIYAGASPFSCLGELPGSRNEFILSLQDVVDQPAIVRQYMRHVGQINSGLVVAQTVRRALQIASSEPKGPVYVWARREPMEEMLSAEAVERQMSVSNWSPVEPRALAPKTLKVIAEGLLTAKRPYLITSYAGRDPEAVALLAELVETLEIPVHLANPSVVNLPLDHRCIASLGYGMDKDERLTSADVLIILDADIPYTPMFNRPAKDAQVFHLDVDPLKTSMSVFHIDATVRANVHTVTALEQILEAVRGKPVTDIDARRTRVKQYNDTRMAALAQAESSLPSDGSFTVPTLLARVRAAIPERTILLNEGISNYGPAWNHIRPKLPGHAFTSGAASLGWSLSAAMGVQFGQQYDLALAIIGDGSFLFSVPSSVFWIARRYQKPFLCVVLHNGGWKSPRYSALAVHGSGQASKAKPADLHVTFDQPPDYGAIAAAAGGAWSKIIKRADKVDEAVREAVRVVREEKRCAVLDCWLEHF